MAADKDTGDSPTVIRDKLMGIMNIQAVGVQQQISGMFYSLFSVCLIAALKLNSFLLLLSEMKLFM